MNKNDTESYKFIGKKIKSLMEKNNFSFFDLSYKLKISEDRVKRYIYQLKPCNIPLFFIKECSLIFNEPFINFFNFEQKEDLEQKVITTNINKE
jgi:hypothetical protein